MICDVNRNHTFIDGDEAHPNLDPEVSGDGRDAVCFILSVIDRNEMKNGFFYECRV